MTHVFIGIALAVFGLGLIAFGYFRLKKTSVYNLYVEASRPSELAAGVPGYIGGTVTAAQPVMTPYSQQPCVYYWYKVEEEYEETDANGNKSLQWRTISNSAPTGVNFSLQTADGGSVTVNPIDADVHGARQQETMPQAQVQGGGMLGAVVNAASALQVAGRQKITESYIPVGAQIYVGGVVTEQNGQKLFAQDTHYPLVLADKPKASFIQSERNGSIVMYVIGAVLVAAGIAAYELIKK